MNYRFITAAFAALAAGTLAAVLTPRYSESGTISWVITIAAAVLALAVVLLATHQRVDDT